MSCHWPAELEDLVGLTLEAIDKTEDEMTLTARTGEIFRFYHEQDCCEHVSINDINGELDWLLGSPIVLAEVTSNEVQCSDTAREHQEWTFYRLGTNKGTVVIRWLGESDYYSTRVDFERIK